jgi:putative restriction endonuclease
LSQPFRTWYDLIMAERRRWSRQELLVAFRLYCHTPFGRLHQHNPDIIDLAEGLGRTVAAIAMKACNFASLDPAEQVRGIRGLSNVSAADRELWHQFAADSQTIAAEAEAAYERLSLDTAPAPPQMTTPTGPTETPRTVRTRRVQRFFRSAVLNTYDQRCALTGLAVPALLNASHIIPWSVDEHRRADPRNGLCLNALHDRAFDRGLITFDEHWRMVLSPSLQGTSAPRIQRETLLKLEGQPLRLPPRFTPDPAAMAYHRENVYCGTR